MRQPRMGNAVIADSAGPMPSFRMLCTKGETMSDKTRDILAGILFGLALAALALAYFDILFY